MNLDKSILKKIQKTVSDNLSAQKNLEKIIFNLNEFNMNLCVAIFESNEELTRRVLEKQNSVYMSIPILSGVTNCDIELEYSPTNKIQKIYVNYKRYVYTFYFEISSGEDCIIPVDITTDNFSVEGNKVFYKSSSISEMKVPVNILNEIMITFADTESNLSEN